MILESFYREYQTCHSVYVKTSLEIPDKELRDLLRFTKAKTKRQAIVSAIVDYNRRKRMAALVNIPVLRTLS